MALVPEKQSYFGHSYEVSVWSDCAVMTYRLSIGNYISNCVEKLRVHSLSQEIPRIL
jgi:hypothetical protein